VKCVTNLVGKSVENKRFEDVAANRGHYSNESKRNRLGCGLVSFGSGQN
jgi:hypothetical protein